MSYSYEIYNMGGSSVGTQKLSSECFVEDQVNEGLVHEYVVMFLSNQRQANAHTKTRSEVRHSGRKLYRQKGTGNARVGDAGSPIRRKGGVVFGPRNERNYTKNMNKKMKKRALMSAVALKVSSESVFGLDALSLDGIKTKQVVEMLSKIDLLKKKVLIVLPTIQEDAIKSMRNIAKVSYTTVDKLNPYDLVSNKNILFVGDSTEKLESRLK